MPMVEKMTIVGAGLVGSLWALELRRKGYAVEVIERRGDIRTHSEERGRSINLVVTSRGKYALEQAGLWSEVDQISVPVFGRMIHPPNTNRGEVIYQPYGQAGECNYSVSRAELNRCLLDAAEKAGAHFVFEAPVQDIDFERQRYWTLEKGKKVERTFLRLFGTDGAGSAVRRVLVDRMPSQFQERVEFLDADYKELFLPKGKDPKTSLDPKGLHIWPRGNHMMMALPNRDGSFTITVYLPKTGGKFSFERLRDALSVREFFEQQFPDAIPHIAGYVEQFLENPQGVLGTVRTSRWVYEDKVALIGDAAHAIVPFFGQGMNAGFEDVTRLMGAMANHSRDGIVVWQKAFEAYNSEQRPNANAIADMALENWVEMRDRVGDPKFLLRKQVESILERAFPEFYRSRYAMVAYTRIPYVEAQAAGLEQDRILDTLCSNLDSASEVSLPSAESLLRDSQRKRKEGLVKTK